MLIIIRARIHEFFDCKAIHERKRNVIVRIRKAKKKISVNQHQSTIGINAFYVIRIVLALEYSDVNNFMCVCI